MKQPLSKLLNEVRNCTLCKEGLPLGPRPVLQLSKKAKILIAGQAPGKRVHASGIPFDDASGDRLREWMGIDRDTFYDDEKIAILPMGFCYPGTGKNGDLPPRIECAPTWRDKLLMYSPQIEFTLVIGLYAQEWHLKEQQKSNLTETVKAWKEFWPSQLPLPHPSPRNNIWLKKNPWFISSVVPLLQKRIQKILNGSK